MRLLADQFRDRIIRIVVTDRPAAFYPVHQSLALDDMSNLLADCTDAKELMRAKGYGAVGMSVLEMVQLLPLASTLGQRKGRKRRR